MVNNKVYYSNRKIKYSFKNKYSDTFKLKLNYLSCIIYKKLNYYNNYYTEEEKAVNKNKWFIKRKVNDYKPLDKKFRFYLIYIEGNNFISILIRFYLKIETIIFIRNHRKIIRNLNQLSIQIVVIIPTTLRKYL